MENTVRTEWWLDRLLLSGNKSLICQIESMRANMKNSSSTAKIYILGTILIGLGLIGWMVVELEWSKIGLYLLSVFGAVAQTLKVEGPDDKTNYSIAWFVYGFALVLLGPGAAMFVVVVSHLVEWAWHKYPWYIQSFNIGAHVLPVFLAGLVFGTVSQGSQVLNLSGALGLTTANLVFVLANHFLVGMVVKLARGQSFAESGGIRGLHPVPRLHHTIHGDGYCADLA